MISETEPKTIHEEMHITGEELLTTVEKLLHAGNVRRIVIKQGEHSVVEFPLTVGVLGVLMAPMLAAVGAVGALLTHCTVVVERVEPPIEEYIP